MPPQIADFDRFEANVARYREVYEWQHRRPKTELLGTEPPLARMIRTVDLPTAIVEQPRKMVLCGACAATFRVVPDHDAKTQ